MRKYLAPVIERIADWIYPATRPSLIPFRVRLYLGNAVVDLLVFIFLRHLRPRDE